MANQAPGAYINVSAASSNSGANNPTGTWFVLGVAAGPAGIPVPIQSMNDFTKAFGQIVNGSLTGRYSLTNMDSTLLYDSLDVFFREGGLQAFVTRVQPSSSGAAATSGTTGGKFLLTANGKGTWANSSNSSAAGVILSISGYTAGGSTLYSAQINYNGNLMATVGGLSTDTDVINWINSLPAYQSMVTASAITGTTILPASGSTASVYLTSGADAAVSDADTATTLAYITEKYGPGQVSYPGNTSTTTQIDLVNHALAFNRVAILDGQNTASASTLETQAAAIQAGATDPSYGALFAPWINVPGVVNTNPSSNSGIVFSRVVPPSALVAANIAVNDSGNDANVPAAGIQYGSSRYATGVSQSYNSSDRGNLNSAGVNVVRNVPNVNAIAIYGFRSLALDPNWIYFNNVRFRMQVVRDFDFIAEGFVFQEIDGKGHIFGALAGALGGQCQSYWTRGSLYGINAGSAYVVNTGSNVNTPSTIAAGQINAQVSLKMSPFGEFVTINVVKYAVNAALPQ